MRAFRLAEEDAGLARGSSEESHSDSAGSGRGRVDGEGTGGQHGAESYFPRIGGWPPPGGGRGGATNVVEPIRCHALSTPKA